MSEESNKLPMDPISAVGVLSSLNKVPDGYYVVAKTTDGSDADLWKDGLFKSKVTRYLCFSRKTEPEVVVDMKLIDFKDPLPESFTPVQETLDKKEAAMRKRRLCVKMSACEAAETAVCDIQLTAKSKYQLVNYTCVGDINNMGLWYRMGDVPQRTSSQKTKSAPKIDTPHSTTSRIATSRQHEQQNAGIYTMTALEDVPFVVSEKFHKKPQEMQQVNLMGITIKSLAEIEEEFHYNFGTERSIVS
ncbi:multivesicular body subunit 12Bb isoform X1 [Cyprinodon tularosa]|uniref:multivesicular body subunit 12Bb isoform X1 n=1 Tax=Cyprinodon tularosa TaxID=77115 RepID=UPI0018E224FE|nr:multivesicular body subunit 12Bb isoform X1 [Cyprinodon tularosa]